MLNKLLGALLGAPAQQVAEYFKEKQKLKSDYKLAKLRAKVAGERAKEARAIQADTNDHAWEILQIKNSGWKDEFVLLVISIPMIMSFIPGLSPYVQKGFTVLNTTPDYYQWLLLAVYAAIYGIRVWRRK